MKKCPRCLVNKDESHYFKGNSRGLSSYCKPCSAARKRKGTKTREELRSATYSTDGKKKCSKCNVFKNVEEFNKRTDRNGECRPYCRACQSKMFRNWLAKENGGKVPPTREERHSALRASRFPTATTRICTKCGAEKPKADFHSWTCKPCRNLQSAKRYEQSKETRAKQRKEYRAQNLQQVREWSRNGANRRRVRKLGAQPTLTTAEWERVLECYGRKCLCCGATENITQDHVIPLSRGGTHTADNVQPLCGRCNSKKHTKIIDYRAAA